MVLKKLGADLINEQPDGNFPAHGPDPMKPKADRDLAEAVIKKKADLGVLFDADGDRVFFVDDLGRRVDSDIVAALISENFKGSIILDVRSGYLAREFLEKAGKKIIDSRVGHSFIKKMISKEKSSFAAETSGHYYFPLGNGAYFDSGILAAIYFINSLPPKLSQFIDNLPRYFKSGELNFKIKNKIEVIKKLEKQFKKETARIYKIDGLKMEFNSPDWWFSVRPSNTEDLLRLNLEAKNKKVFEERLEEIKKFLK